MVGKTAPGMRLGVLLVMLLVVNAACSGNEETTPETTVASTLTALSSTTTGGAPETTTATTTTTTATTQPTTTTTDPPERPEVLVSNFDRDSVDDFDTAGDNLWVVMMEIQDLYDFFEGNPQGSGPEMLGVFYSPGYENFDLLAEDLQQLVDNEWRYVDAGTRTVAIDVQDSDGNTAIVSWASERGDQLVADSSGEIVETYEGWDLDVITYRLVRGLDRRWRITEFIDRVHPVPAATLDSMVPVEWTGRDP